MQLLFKETVPALFTRLKEDECGHLWTACSGTGHHVSGMKERNLRTSSNLSGTMVNRLYHCSAPEYLYSLPSRERKNIPPAHPGNPIHAAI